MKVLFIFHDSERNNGANHSMMDIIDYLADSKDIEPYIAFPKKSGSAIDYAKNRNYKVYKLRYGRWDFPLDLKGIEFTRYGIKWIAKLFMSINAYFILKKEIKKNDIQIIYTNTYSVFLGAWLSNAIKIPHIWHIREFGKEDHNFKIVFGDDVLYKTLNFCADKIIFISQSIQTKYQPHIYDPSKCIVLYNDIRASKYDVYARWKKVDTINFLIAGTIQEGKGQLEAIKAIEILKSKYHFQTFKLYIAGKKQGNYYEKIYKYVIENNLQEWVEFCGFVPQMEELRAKMHIGIVSSRNEAFGRVTIEGMLAGMLMIGADVAGTKELIQNKKTGLLYSLYNPENLAVLLNNCVRNLDWTRKLALNGNQYAIESYAQNKTSKKIRQILQDFI